MSVIKVFCGAVFAVLVLCGHAARADALRPSGKLLLTDGVGAIEGEAGGGLAAWSVITGGATADGIGVRLHATRASLSDFDLTTVAVGVGLFDKVELSYAHQSFDTGRAGAKLGIGKGFTFDQDIIGAKVKLFGDAVYDQDRMLPQVSLGVQIKSNDSPAILKAVGARHDRGVDVYLAASKLFLSKSLFLSAAVRATKANQFGILGFGGDRGDRYSAQGEFSAAYLVSKRLAVGAEFRTKPDNLKFAHEDSAKDVFAAYAVSKRLSLTVAYVDAGRIATFPSQRGVYVSLRAGF